jgi:hypothetical protein
MISFRHSRRLAFLLVSLIGAGADARTTPNPPARLVHDLAAASFGGVASGSAVAGAAKYRVAFALVPLPAGAVQLDST